MGIDAPSDTTRAIPRKTAATTGSRTPSPRAVETYRYDAFSNRLLSVGDGAVTRSFGYAADGSVISDDRGLDAFDLDYDAAGRLKVVKKNSSPEAAYAYDAFGRRALKDPVSSGATHYHYDPDGRLLAESTGSGVPEREYIWLPLDGQAWALPIALVTEADTASPRLHYLHADPLGTPVAMTSANLGQLEWRAVYRPFGELHAITGTQDLALRFPGQLFDPEAGFHQNWHRDYDPRLGRYLQSDPIGLEGGLNTYAYALGDPVNVIDHDGQNPIKLVQRLFPALKQAWKDTDFDGPAGTRICQIRFKTQPVVRLDYGPYRGTHGEPRLHGHLPRLLPDKHIPLDPRSLFD